MLPDADSFLHRAQLSEWMDEPCSYAEFRDCLRDLMRVNRMVFGYRPTLRWLRQFAGRVNRPLRIVDVGCGAGDMLRRIERWADKNGVPVQLTGIDRNPYAAEAAREFSGAKSRIEWLSCDAFHYNAPEGIDLVVSSLFTHHLTDSDIERFIAWMERTATLGWFINDLYRSERFYSAFKLLASAMRWHRFVQHDGPVSIQRSFRVHDWAEYTRRAGLQKAALRIESAWPGRLCVARVKE